MASRMHTIAIVRIASLLNDVHYQQASRCDNECQKPELSGKTVSEATALKDRPAPSDDDDIDQQTSHSNNEPPWQEIFETMSKMHTIIISPTRDRPAPSDDDDIDQQTSHSNNEHLLQEMLSRMHTTFMDFLERTDDDIVDQQGSRCDQECQEPELLGKAVSEVTDLVDMLAALVKEILGLYTSRYKKEFQELELLGKGGFGKVYKVKHLNGKQYAVKKIPINLLKLLLLRESMALLNLRHSNIVEFIASWIEDDSSFSSSDSSSSHGSTGSKDTSSSVYQNSGLSCQDKSSSIEFKLDAEKEEMEKETDKKRIQDSLLPGGGGITPRHVSSSDLSTGSEDTSSSVSQNSGLSYQDESIEFKSDTKEQEMDKRKILESTLHAVVGATNYMLYIQMELCDHTLYEWLMERNSEYSSKGYELSRMCAINMRIFHQLLKGVQFIHSHGFIHRDLKPRNIFLSLNDLHVKIGDFGLAKRDIYLQESKGLAASSAYSHTSGVGTSTYASPEQLESSSYDAKSDMYSLGVILFEIFNVFSTEMERLKCIEDLRQRNECSPDIKKKWPEQAKMIESLTSPDPSKRPTAEDLLNSELFLSQEEKNQTS